MTCQINITGTFIKQHTKTPIWNYFNHIYLDAREINYGLGHSAYKNVFVRERITQWNDWCYVPDTHDKEFMTVAQHQMWE